MRNCAGEIAFSNFAFGFLEKSLVFSNNLCFVNLKENIGFEEEKIRFRIDKNIYMRVYIYIRNTIARGNDVNFAYGQVSLK